MGGIALFGATSAGMVLFSADTPPANVVAATAAPQAVPLEQALAADSPVAVVEKLPAQAPKAGPTDKEAKTALTPPKPIKEESKKTSRDEVKSPKPTVPVAPSKPTQKSSIKPPKKVASATSEKQPERKSLAVETKVSESKFRVTAPRVKEIETARPVEAVESPESSIATPKQEASVATPVSTAVPEVKAVQALPLVAETFSPVVMLATEDRAWVKVEKSRTVIVRKGESVPGLGVFMGQTANGAKFDEKVVPIKP